MKKDPRVFLAHILESINYIENYLKRVTDQDFFQSNQIQDAVIRRLEIIGEAAKNIPEDFKKAHTDIPWQKISGLRNKLIHEYFGVDLKLLLAVAEKDLPELKKQITNLLDRL